MNKVHLPAMTWKEAEAAFANKPVVLFPMGSIEQHGPHAPVGDYRMAEHWAIEAAKIAGNAVVLPVMPFGDSETFRRFPGTLTVKTSTLYAVVKDVVECVLDFGVTHMLFINGHRGNDPALQTVAEEIHRERGLVVGSVAPFSCVTPAYEEELYGEAVVNLGHGSDPVASMAMHLYPDEMRMDLAEPMDKQVDHGPFSVLSASHLRLEGVPVRFYQYYDEVFPNGVNGDPQLLDPEKGRLMSERIVEMLVKVIDGFRGLDTAAKAWPGRAEG